MGAVATGISVVFEPSATSVLEGTEVSFENTSTAEAGIKSYLWDFGDGSKSAARNPKHVYSSSGGYRVRLRVTDQNDATKVASANISVVEEYGVSIAPTARNGRVMVTIVKRDASGDVIGRVTLPYDIEQKDVAELAARAMKQLSAVAESTNADRAAIKAALRAE